MLSYQLTFFSERPIGLGVLCCLVLCAYAAGALVSSDALNYIADVQALAVEALAASARQVVLLGQWYMS